MKKHYSMLLLLVVLLSSCGSTKLTVSDVSYQSVRNMRTDLQKEIPGDAKIAIYPQISSSGELSVVVMNLTDEIMVIDRTKSFFVNSNGTSVSYYDPTVKTSSNTTLDSNTSGVGVNLGAIGSAIGIGGVLGTALSGVNVGSSSTSGNSVTNTTYEIDQPTASLAPKGKANMGRDFLITGIGDDFMEEFSKMAKERDVFRSEIASSDSYCKFSICISYSLDGGKTFEKFVSDYYANSILLSYVRSKGDVNASLRNIYKNKANVLDEPWFLLYFNDNIFGSLNRYVGNELYDYK